MQIREGSLMIKIRTMKHIASSKTADSFRACRAITRANREQGRMMLGYAKVLTHDEHRKWRNGMWQVCK
mgnify:CR=1 FL=1